MNKELEDYQEIDEADDSGQQPQQQRKRARRRGRKRNMEPEVEAVSSDVVISTVSDIDRLTPDESVPISQESAATRKPTGFFGKVSDELRAYLKSIESVLSAEVIETKEADEREILLQNIYHEIDGKELIVSTDHDCSLILEKLLRVSSEFHLRVFMDRLSGRYFDLALHRFGSHVLQSLLGIVPELINSSGPANMNIIDNQQEGELLSLMTLICNICDELSPFASQLIVDPNGSHILRTLLLILSGTATTSLPTSLWQKSSKKSTQAEEASTIIAIDTENFPVSFRSKLESFVESLLNSMEDSEIRIYASHPVANPFLQTFLHVLSPKDPRLTHMLINKILLNFDQLNDETMNRHRKELFDALVSSPVGSHLIQTIIMLSDKALFHNIISRLFQAQILALSMHQVANYVVQTLIEHCPDGKHFKIIVSELLDHFEQLLFGERGNVVIRILKTATHLNCMVEQLSIRIYNLFSIPSESEKKKRQYLDVLLRLQRMDEFERSAGDICAVGVHLVSSLAKMPHPHNQILVTSALSKTEKYLSSLACHPIGTRALQEIFESDSIDSKTKNKLIRNMEGTFAIMATDKYGCFLIDCCWKYAELSTKKRIASELVKDREKLAQNFYGSIILRNCKIDLFQRKVDEWQRKWEVGIGSKRSVEIEELFGKNSRVKK